MSFSSSYLSGYVTEKSANFYKSWDAGSGSGSGHEASGSGSGKASGSGSGDKGSGSGSGHKGSGSGSGKASGSGSGDKGSGSGSGHKASGSGSGKASGSGSGKASGSGSGKASGSGSGDKGSGSGDDGGHGPATGTISGTVFCDTNCDGVNGEFKTIGSGSGSGDKGSGKGSGSGSGDKGSGKGSGSGSGDKGSGKGSGSGSGDKGSGSGSGKGSGSGSGDKGSASGSGDDTVHIPEPVKAGVLIKLLDLSGGVVAETTTDGHGNYTFQDVPIGDYKIMGVAPDGTEFTIQDVDGNSKDHIDSDVDEGGLSAVIHVTKGSKTDIDLGVCEKKDDCIKVTENTTGPIVDLDCGDGANPDAGKDICALTDKDMNGFGEDTEKPTSYTLSLGETLTDEIDSSQGKKLEVSAVHPGDDGDGSYYILVSDDDDPSKLDKVYFSGDVGTGQSFTANAIDGKFGSETFVHIFSSDGGTLLQTINFHTSCSAPLVIGDQYGSVSLEGASLVGKDTGTVYEVGGSSAPGDEGVTYSIKAGPGSDLFEVNADGEVSFKEAPDFEDPQGLLDADGNPSNNYEVVVLATLEDGSVIEKPLEVCVENDCIKVTENTTGPIVDLDCGEGENPDVGLDICVLTDKDMNGFGEDTDKPSSFVLSLGDLSETLVTSATGDARDKVNDKVEVGNLGGSDDSDGSYFILVSDDDDPSKLDKVYFSGDVGTGQSFTANGIDGKFGSETFVHIFSSEGGSLLQTINFHTSCSSPLIIGDQYGSIFLEGASLVGKDTDAVYEVGGSSAPGDAGVTYSIKAGPGSDLFEVNADGEVSFRDAPDFENPQGLPDADGNPTNNYEVVVLATLEDGTVTEKPVEICVEDDPSEPVGALTGRYFCDDNRDSTENDGQGGFDAGVAGKVVALFTADGTFVADTTTNGNGVYRFDDLDAGDYYVEFEAEAGKEFVAPNVGPDGEDSDVVDPAAGRTETVKVVAGAETQNLDGGVRKIFVKCDDPNAVKVDFEGFAAGDVLTNQVDGLTISATGGSDDAMVFDSFNPTGGDIDLATAEQGNILIVSEDGDTSDPDDVVGGTLSVEFDTPSKVFDLKVVDTEEGGTITATLSDGSTVAFAIPSIPDGAIDQVILDLENVTKLEIALTGSGAIDDICYVPGEPPLGALSGRYFCDTDNNDVDDGQAIDPGVAGVVVTLFDAAGTVVGTTTTGSEGLYRFDDVPPGTYSVEFTDPGGALDGKQLVTPNQGGDDTVDSDAIGDTTVSVIENIVVEAGKETADNDAGAEFTASLGDFVFEDLDADGIQDAGEAGIGGVTVTLTGGGADGVIGTGADDTTATTMTDANGAYLFAGLNPGEEYQVSFDQPAGFTEVSPADQGGDDTVDSDGLTAPIVTLTSGETNDTIDQGFYNLASLGDRVFEDTNGDGIQDGGEPGVPGVTVELLDGDGNLVATDTTDANGDYLFEGLEPGDYQVRFTPPAGFEFTTPNQGPDDAADSDADPTSGLTQTVTLASGDNNLTLDAGLVQTAALGDFVFEDLDADGIQDAGEAGIGGVTVTLTGGGADGVIGTGADDTTATTMTDANGAYLFAGLNPGEEYQVSFDQPAGFTEVSPADQGGDDTVDSDGLTAPIVTLTSGETNDTIDQGFYNLASLGDRVFEDLNGDGIQDGGEPGVPGVTVELLDGDGNLVATDTTDANGDYLFEGLEPGDYQVRFTPPAGFEFTTPNQGPDDAADSDADPTSGLTQTVTLASGDNNLTLDAGLVQTAALGDFVFEDLDADGIQDAGEAGIGGVTVTLTGGGADGVIGTGADDTTATTMTDANGAYLFAGLNPGEEYQVSFDQPAGFTEVSPADQGGDDTVDSDGLTAPIVTLTSGETNDTIDQGFYNLASLGDRVFEDLNGDGIQDGGEPGVPGVTVELLDGDGNLVATDTTDANGDYLFEGLEPGDYQVRFTPPAGFEFTTPNQGPDDAADSDADPTSGLTQTVTLASGDNNLTLDAGLVQTAALGDFVFEDLDADGIQDAGEAGIGGVTVTLTGGGADGVIGTGADDTTATTMTDANGAYLFAGLNPGEEYQVSFDQPAGFTEVSPADQGGDDTVDSDGLTAPIVTLTSGETNDTIDQGFYNLASLGDFVFEDLNGDGEQDPGEPGVENVTVKLFKDGTDTGQTTTTDANGAYSFTGLVPGAYSVMFVAPAGFAFTTANAAGVDDALDSDANPTTGLTQEITLTSGEFNGTLDAGLVDVNDPPDAVDDMGKVCADELLTLDVLDNDTDPDADTLEVVTVGGQAVSEGTTVTLDGAATITARDGGTTVEAFTGLSVTLTGGELVIDGAGAFSDLEIGETAELSFNYGIEDPDGLGDTAAVDLTFCGALTTVDSIAADLPADLTVVFSVDGFGTGAGQTPLRDAYTVFVDASDDRFDGTFTAAYCLDINRNIVRDVDVPAELLVATDTLAAGSSLDQQTLDNLDLVNWLINQELEGTASGTGTGDGVFSDAEIQAAIWDIIGDTPFLPGGTGTQADVAELVSLAETNGEGFVPGDGDLFTFVLDPIQPNADGHAQPFIFALPFDQECIC